MNYRSSRPHPHLPFPTLLPISYQPTCPSTRGPSKATPHCLSWRGRQDGTTNVLPPQRCPQGVEPNSPAAGV